jgi:TolB-like protein/Tfp pilus assembly protein PilF
MGLVSELRRRNVLRMAVLYAVAAWLVMQVAEVLIDLAKLPDWIGTTTLGLLAVGFPIALIFSWFYELTPEGISLEKDVDPAESITHITGRRLDFIVISLLCAGLILFSYDKWWIGPPPEKSIAVLAFENMSADPEQEFFSDGISEEILNVLAHIPDLHVTSRSSAFGFKGKDINIPTVAKQLGVATVLEGSVRKSGNRVRISAQLIDARTDRHLWSETYDRDLENIFAVQDEISVAIVGALKEHLGLKVEVAPRVIAAANTEAHEAYLRGRYLVVQRTVPTIQGAVREFEKAIALDPDYALAHAELAIAALLLRTYGDLTLSEAIAKATPHAEQAMALDPTLAEAHAATGLLLRGRRQSEEALTHFEQAIRINPNYAIVYNFMGVHLVIQLGQYDEGFAAYEAAWRLDPLSIPSRANYVGWLIHRNRLDEAERELEKFASIAPRSYASKRGELTSLGGKWANLVLGRLDDLRLEPDRPNTRIDLAWLFAAIGLEKEALAISEAPQPIVLRWLGKSGDAVTIAEARLAEDPISLFARHDLGLALAGVGDYARAKPILEETWQLSGKRVTCCDIFHGYSAAALIAMRRDAGEEAEVGELVAAIRANVRRYHEAGIVRARILYDLSVDYEEGLAAYLSAERERGLALIAEGAEDGFFIPQREAYLQTLYDDPGFAPIRASQEARQARERERFLAIVCTDNPYAAVWQPAEGTCEQFAAAGGN